VPVDPSSRPPPASPLDDADGDLDVLVPKLYAELRALAHAQRMRHGANETLNTTALLHEAYLKLSAPEAAWESRQHFFRSAARVMRHVMVDHARRARSAKRGGTTPDLPLDEAWMRPLPEGLDLAALDEALTRLAVLDARQAEIVDLRFFVGLTIDETADVMGLSPATVKRDWTVARAWLYDAMKA